MGEISEAWQEVQRKQDAILADKIRRDQEAYEAKMAKRLMEFEEAKLKQAAQPPRLEQEIALTSEIVVARNGKHFLVMRSSVTSGSPMLYTVRKIENKEAVSFPVVNGNSFEALQAAVKLFYNRVYLIGSTRPADTPIIAE